MSNETDIDGKIVSSLWNREEQALELVTQKYGSYMRTIADNILTNPLDTEECINDTLVNLWESIPPHKPTSLKAYLATLVRNHALDCYRKNTREKRVQSEYTVCLEELEESLSSVATLEAELDRERLTKVMEEFLSKVSEQDRRLFICRYYCGDSVERIAGDCKISPSTVFHKLKRLRTKLKNTLIKEDLWNEN